MRLGNMVNLNVEKEYLKLEKEYLKPEMEFKNRWNELKRKNKTFFMQSLFINIYRIYLNFKTSPYNF